MSSSVWLTALVSAVWTVPGNASPPDPSCNLSEVTRLLWTMIAVSAGAGALTVVRPSRRRVLALTAAALVWLWIDMEGPVLASRGTHGLHVADLPVVVSAVAVLAAVLRLRRAGPTRPA